MAVTEFAAMTEQETVKGAVAEAGLMATMERHCDSVSRLVVLCAAAERGLHSCIRAAWELRLLTCRNHFKTADGNANTAKRTDLAWSCWPTLATSCNVVYITLNVGSGFHCLPIFSVLFAVEHTSLPHKETPCF